MKYQWDWLSFFIRELRAEFVIDVRAPDHFTTLYRLPFDAGLQVIVSSVLTFDQREWLIFEREIQQNCHNHQHLEYWLLVGQLMRQHASDVRQWLQCDGERAVQSACRKLAQHDDVDQFAIVACLHHYATTNVKAQMMFYYLLHRFDQSTRQMHHILRFYRGLTGRQKDVAILLARGYTNQEIADMLHIEPNVVSEHLTIIFEKFQQVRQFIPKRHGTRYRLIHWLTRLFDRHPHLIENRQN